MIEGAEIMTRRRNDTGEELEAVVEAAASDAVSPAPGEGVGAGVAEAAAPAAVTLVLVGANVLIAGSRKFVKGRPTSVDDPDLAERLLKSGLCTKG